MATAKTAAPTIPLSKVAAELAEKTGMTKKDATGALDEFVDEVAGPGNRIEGGTAKSVVEYIAKSIVDTPEAVDVTSKERGDGVELLIAADPDDMGRLIGKRGRVIQAVRQVARAAGAADGVTTSVDVLE